MCQKNFSSLTLMKRIWFLFSVSFLSVRSPKSKLANYKQESFKWTVFFREILVFFRIIFYREIFASLFFAKFSHYFFWQNFGIFFEFFLRNFCISFFNQNRWKRMKFFPFFAGNPTLYYGKDVSNTYLLSWKVLKRKGRHSFWLLIFNLK